MTRCRLLLLNKMEVASVIYFTSVDYRFFVRIGIRPDVWYLSSSTFDL